jgi:hypothetical protein
MSYGTAVGVAALSYLYTNNGVFLDADSYVTATKPSLSEVEEWLTEASASLDIALEDEGFITPVTVAAVLPSLNGKVQAVVKDMVDFSHGAGRFFTDKRIEGGASPMMVIEKEFREWVTEHSIGLESMGVPKRQTISGRNTATIDVI